MQILFLLFRGRFLAPIKNGEPTEKPLFAPWSLILKPSNLDVGVLFPIYAMLFFCPLMVFANPLQECAFLLNSSQPIDFSTSGNEAFIEAVSHEGLFGGRPVVTIAKQRLMLIFWSQSMPKARYVSSTFPIVIDTTGTQESLTVLTPAGLNDWFGSNIFVSVPASDQYALTGDDYHSYFALGLLPIMMNKSLEHDVLQHAPTFAELMRSPVGARFKRLLNRARNFSNRSVGDRVINDLGEFFEIQSVLSSEGLIRGDRAEFEEFLLGFSSLMDFLEQELDGALLPET